MCPGPARLFVTLFGVRSAIHHLVGESRQYLNNFEPSALAEAATREANTDMAMMVFVEVSPD